MPSSPPPPTSRPVPAGRHCRLLEEDPDLAAVLTEAERVRAVDHCIARELVVGVGDWPAERMKLMDDGIGLLVLDGLLLRSVGIDGRFGAELLGSGDLLRPWQGEDVVATLSATTGWRVLDRARLAVLDTRVAGRLALFPALTGALVARALNRSRALSTMMAIVHQPRIEVRLHMLFWHLADRWGRVRRDGVILPLGLTHAILADLIAAQRPTVSTALSRLAQARLISRAPDGWLLCGDPPGELLELQEVSISPPGDDG